MYLTGHAAVGVAMAAAANIDNPAGAFAVGWLSHYVADAVPHGDEPVGEWAKKGNRLKRTIIVFLIDATVLAAIYLTHVAVAGFTWWVLAAVIGSTIPDVMWGLEMLFKRRLFGNHEKLHGANHNLFDIKVPLWLGLLLQLAVAMTLWWFVTFR